MKQQIEKFFETHADATEVHEALGVLFTKKEDAEKFCLAAKDAKVITHERPSQEEEESEEAKAAKAKEKEVKAAEAEVDKAKKSLTKCEVAAAKAANNLKAKPGNKLAIEADANAKDAVEKAQGILNAAEAKLKQLTD